MAREYSSAILGDSIVGGEVKLKFKEGQIVLVEWEDAWRDLSSYDEGEIVEYCKALPLQSVGFLAYKDKRGIILAQERNPIEDAAYKWRAVNFIPAAGILKIVILKK